MIEPIVYHSDIEAAELRFLVRSGKLRFGGNSKLKIYGTPGCKSGKRMLITNRVFFDSEKAAIHAGYRPCAHCLYTRYKAWKHLQNA